MKSCTTRKQLSHRASVKAHNDANFLMSVKYVTERRYTDPLHFLIKHSAKCAHRKSVKFSHNRWGIFSLEVPFYISLLRGHLLLIRNFRTPCTSIYSNYVSGKRRETLKSVNRTCFPNRLNARMGIRFQSSYFNSKML